MAIDKLNEKQNDKVLKVTPIQTKIIRPVVKVQNETEDQRVATAPANIGLSSQFGRPHTANTLPELQRPGTGPLGSTGMKLIDLAQQQRAVSAGFNNCGRIARYEDITLRLK